MGRLTDKLAIVPGWPKMRVLALIGFLSVVGLVRAHAGDESKVIVPFSPLPPWKFVDEQGFDGAYAEVVREIAARLNKSIEFIKCPLKRCLRLMQTGEGNLIIGVSATADRVAYIRFLDTPYRISSAKVFYLKKGGGSRIREHADLYGLRVGTKLGAKYAPQFDNDAGVRKVAAATNRQTFEMLDRGRIDALIIAEDQGEYWISQLGYRGKFDKAEFFYRDQSPRSVGVSRRSPLIEEFAAIEAAMRGLVGEGKLADIYRRQYFERFGIPMNPRTTRGGGWVSELTP